MNTMIELSQVTKVYDSGRRQAALDAVSLAIPASSITAVMGPSGSGKSTLLHLVAGLDRPTTGTIVVAGTDLRRLSEAALARFRRARVGLIFQFFNLLDDLCALDNVLLPAQLAGTPMVAARVRGLDLLDRLGIAGLRGQYPARLSGGERQRVAIARALMNQPDIVLADEPTGALDTKAGQEVMAILGDLNRSGHTIIVVTHDPALAASLGSRVVRLVDGRVSVDVSGESLRMVRA